MVEIKQERYHYFDDKKGIWAVTKEEFVNGANRSIKRTIEEKYSLEDVKQELDKEIPEQMSELKKELRSLKSKYTNLQRKVKPKLNRRGYKEFKKYYLSDEYKLITGINQQKEQGQNVDTLIKAVGKAKIEKYNKHQKSPKAKEYYLDYVEELHLSDLKSAIDRVETSIQETKDWETQMKAIMRDIK